MKKLSSIIITSLVITTATVLPVHANICGSPENDPAFATWIDVEDAAPVPDRGGRVPPVPGATETSPGCPVGVVAHPNG